MKYKKYLSTAFLALLLLPFLSAKTAIAPKEDFDVSTISFIEEDQHIDLGFETTSYLPDGFNPYKEEIPIKEIIFMEEESIQLDFDTAPYLPEDFDPYQR